MRRIPLAAGVCALIAAGAGVSWATNAPDDPQVVPDETAPTAEIDEVDAPLDSSISTRGEQAPQPETADTAATAGADHDEAESDDAESVATSPTTTEAPTTTVAPAPTTTVAPAPTTTVAPTPTHPPTTTVAAVAFTAHQAYGSCGEDVPYDIFSGTATPGTSVSVSSAHGSGSTTVDSSGHWELTVEFPNAPRNETFAVSVTGSGGSASFSFTATGESH